MNRMMLTLSVTICAAFAGVAAADTPAPAPVRASMVTVAPRLPYDRRQVSLPPGIVRTALEHRFSDERLVGSAGFLCGLQDHPVHDGGAGAYGSDPDGRFLGATLRLRFH